MDSKILRSLLVFVPQWIPLNPHFSLCQLAGHLRGEGHDVLVEDLNIGFYRHVLTPEYLTYSMAKAENVHEYLNEKLAMGVARGERGEKACFESARFLEIDRYLEGRMEEYHHLLMALPDAISVFDERERFYRPFELVKAFIAVDKALEVVSLPYFPARIKFNDFFTPLFPLTMQGLINFTTDKDENLFYRFLSREATRLLGLEARLIGISINSPTQLFPGLTLASMLMKRKPPGTFLALGGNYFTRLSEVLSAHREFFTLFADAVVLGEGERPLCKLIDELEKSHGAPLLSAVPSLVYIDGEEPRATPRGAPLSLNELHMQDLVGLPMGDYFVPDPVISVQSSKGCYWQKCTFCDTDFGITPDVKAPDRLMAEVRLLRHRFGITHFEFIDESILPQYMEEFSKRLLAEKLDIAWFSNGRTEEAFTEGRLRLFRESGLLMILWGVESGCRRIMDLVNKGVHFDKRLEILRRSAAAGIWNFAYIFFGFPTETEAEAAETISLIRDHTDIIHSYGRSIFTLGKHSKLREKSMLRGLIHVIHDDMELSTSLAYESTSGMAPLDIMKVAEICKYACAEKYGEPLWMYLRYREVLFLYLRHCGLPFLLSHTLTGEERQAVQREAFMP
ncbi:MAG: radical SAM protein [Candidatus Eremiobacteraeota bacterium]|nr:radical SAM protein [Candidatus Eremiobacteraeota bacterium]